MKKKTIIFMFIVFMMSYAVSAQTINIKNATLPTPRSALSCAENSDTHNIYCFGGYRGGNQILEYNPFNDTLVLRNSTLPTGIPERRDPSCAENSATHKIYCFGGEYGRMLDEIVEYDPSIDNVTIKTARLPRASTRMSCVENSATHSIYCFGGLPMGGSREILEYIPAYDIIITKQAILPHGGTVSCVENPQTNKIYCFGGEYGVSSNPPVRYSDEILEYDPLADNITIKSAKVPSQSTAVSCAPNRFVNKIYCFGGYNITNGGGIYFDYIFEYNPVNDTVTIESVSLPTPRAFSACSPNSANGRVYCFGGQYEFYSNNIPLNQIIEYINAVNISTTNVGGSSISPLLKTSTDPLRLRFSFQPNEIFFNRTSLPPETIIGDMVIVAPFFASRGYSLRYYIESREINTPLYYGFENFGFMPRVLFGVLHFSPTTSFYQDANTNALVTVPIAKAFLGNTYFIQALAWNGNEFILSDGYKVDLP